MEKGWLPTKLEKYVYLATLEIGSPPERKLAKYIKSELIFKNDLSTPNTDFYNKITDALAILKQIANNEKSKELNAIATHKSKIQKFINDDSVPLIIKKDFQKQLELLDKVYDGIENQNEINLIKNINIVEQDYRVLQRRLSEMQHIKEHPKDIWNVLEYRQEEQLDQFLKYLTTNKSSKGKKLKNEAIAKILKKTLKETVGNEYNDIPGFQELLLGLVYIDFMDQIQNEYNFDIYKLNFSDLKNFLQQYYKKNTDDKREKERTQLINLLTHNLQESRHLINDFSNFLGVQFIDEKRYNLLQNKLRTIEQLKKEGKTSSQITETIGQSEKQIKDRIKLYEQRVTEQNNIMTIRVKNATSHGFLNEIRRIIQKNGIDIEKNVGIDNIVPICTLTINSNEQILQDELLSASRDINDILGKNFVQNQQSPITLSSLTEAIEAEKTMNQEIQKKIEDSRKKINEIKEEEGMNTFLSFESLKLSRTHEMEQSIKNDYKGRTMNILSALTKLYAAPGFSEALINLDTLIIFLLNISKTTLGEQNKAPLETYLSLFAGILMFDDISYMASEALKNIANEIPQEGKTNILHVYGINNIYFPISAILDNLIIQVEEAIQSQSTLFINSDKTAHAHIIQRAPSFNKKNSTQKDWEELSEKTIQSTKIQIGFLAGFINYIGDLNKSISL